MIEQELRALPIAFPPDPDLEARVLARLPRPRRPLWLVPAIAALAAAAALLAIPQTRAAILDFFRIGGVTVERVETQPRAPAVAPELGPRVTLAEAAAEVDFPLLVPDAEFVTRFDGELVNLTWDRYVLSQWRAVQLPYHGKQIGPNSRVVSVEVRGSPGVWITGARHELLYQRPGEGEVRFKERRLVGNVLIWDDDGITYRLEGPRSVDEARRIARDLRAP
jgi:hypothetical protein